MIVFKPKEENKNTGTISSFQRNFGAIGAKKTAAMLNKKNIDIKCNNHPDEDGIILVKMTDGKPQFEIEHTCCDEMKDRLLNFLGVR